MMELVDVGDSKSPGSDAVPVRVRPGALEPNPRFGLNRGDARVFCWIRGQFVENSRCIFEDFPSDIVFEYRFLPISPCDHGSLLELSCERCVKDLVL